jgi:hypothetical protein
VVLELVEGERGGGGLADVEGALPAFFVFAGMGRATADVGKQLGSAGRDVGVGWCS